MRIYDIPIFKLTKCNSIPIVECLSKYLEFEAETNESRLGKTEKVVISIRYNGLLICYNGLLNLHNELLNNYKK